MDKIIILSIYRTINIGLYKVKKLEESEKQLHGLKNKGDGSMAKRVLVVDDAAFMRMMLKNILTSAGYEVIGEAENGEKALFKYKELKPDVVTLDITMPDVDGITAVKNIIEYDPKARIIMCSAMGQQTMVLDAIKAGAKDFIIKPFQKERVIEALKKLND